MNLCDEKKRQRKQIAANVSQAVAKGELILEDESFRIAQKLLCFPQVVAARTILVYINIGNEVQTLPWLPGLFGLPAKMSGDRSEAPQNSPVPPEPALPSNKISGDFSSAKLPFRGESAPCVDFWHEISNISQKTPSSFPKSVWTPYCLDDELALYELQRPTWSATENAYHFADLSRGAFGILEPRPERRLLLKQKLPPIIPEIVVVPGVAFSPHGARLGRGKGFYDRFFQKLSPCPLLIGVAFDQQIDEKIPLEPHDRAVDFVVTPSQIYPHFPAKIP